MSGEVTRSGSLDSRPTRALDALGLNSPDLDAADAEIHDVGVHDVDPWAWLDRDDVQSEHVDTSGCRVTAVLVALDAARWLPETLAGLAALRRRPDRLIAIETHSTDSTLLLLERARDAGVLDAVYCDPDARGFGAAVSSALRQDAESPDRSPGARSPEAAEQVATRVQLDWLWLLHDDAVPAPDALDRLLTHVTVNRSIDVTGPKLLLPRRQHQVRRLSEIGVSISSTGRREVLVDTGEVDQGQRDEPRARLGVSTCGLLVWRSVWEELNGLDPALPVFRDGVDFGWRAHLAGYSVVTTPSAEFTHRQVGRAGLRPSGAAGRRPNQADRFLGMLVVAAHSRRHLLPLVWLRLVASCLLRSCGYLVGKAPARARDELFALASFVFRPGELRALRRRLRTVPRAPGAADVVRTLRPRWWSGLRIGAEVVSHAVSDRYHSVAGDADVPLLDELTGDDFSAVTEERSGNPWLAPIVVVGALTVVASLVAARDLLSLGSLTAPALLPAHSSLADLWRSVWAPIYGAPSQSSPPWLALMALGSTVFGGWPELFVTVLLCAVVPLSLLSAYPVVRRVIQGRRVRLWVATTYALLPVLLGGTNQGRLSLSVFGIGLPLLVLAARAVALRRPLAPEAWRGGWGAGIVLVGLVAFEPSLLLFAVVVALVGVVVLRRSPRKAGRVGIALAVPLVVLAPWWPSIIAAPGRLLTGPDSAVDGVPSAPEVWQLMLGREVGPGLPPLWLGAVVFSTIWAVALVGLLRRPRSRAVLAGWLVGLLALAAAVALSRLVVAVPPVGAEVRPWSGAYLLIGFGALVLAGGVGIDGLSHELGRRSFSWLQPLAVLAGLLVGVVTLLATGWWVWAGAAGPIDRTRLDALPPYVVNALQSDNAVRVLAVDLSGGAARYFVVAGDQTRLGDADRGFTFGGSADAPAQSGDLVTRMVAGTADADIAPQLRRLGIGFVFVTGGTDQQQIRVGSTPGLGAASGNLRGTVWQLEPAVSRVTLAAPDERFAAPVLGSPTVVSAGPPGRLLRVGEAADPRWRGTLDGAPLPAVTDGWQQAFAVPAAGGVLDYRLPVQTRWYLLAQGLVLLLAVVLAAPGIRRPEVRDPTRTSRRAATLGGVRP